jgi:hypothetical protein
VPGSEKAPEIIVITSAEEVVEVPKLKVETTLKELLSKNVPKVPVVHVQTPEELVRQVEPVFA